jgi:hypothetical protein
MWLKCVNGTYTYYIRIGQIERMTVNGTTISVYTSSGVTGMLASSWNAGQLLDDQFAIVGPNPMQV